MDRTCGTCAWAIAFDEHAVHCGHESNGRRDCRMCRGKQEECLHPKRWWKPAKAEAKPA